MVEYLIQDTTLTGMADEIRRLNGSTGTLKPGAMITELQTVNTAIATQEDLLAQVITAIASKAAPTGTYTIHIGTAEPTADIGSDGDIYILRSDAT